MKIYNNKSVQNIIYLSIFDCYYNYLLSLSFFRPTATMFTLLGITFTKIKIRNV